MLSADGTLNLGNEVKPKPKQCLVVWHPGSLPLPPLATPAEGRRERRDNADNAHLVTGLPPSAPTTPQIQHTAQELFPSPPPVPPPLFARVVGSHEHADIELLASLRQHSHTAEQALYAQLATTPVVALNDVRHAFMIVAKGAGRPARVGGKLAGVAAAGVDACGAERQEQVHVIVFSAKQLFTASTQ
ncbi:hypothetical protein B0H14DRAFT_3874003 [Mycena olivaceomarginata]|nr:hypothetical protein B0H14DRAFT_3874003 [Mycena olivaceomarginata]